MVALASLWMPIVVAAVLVFIASSIIHMVLPIHKSDYKGFSNEDEIRAAIRKGNPGPGIFMMPYCGDMKEMKSPEMLKKWQEGPVGMVVLRAPGAMSMGPALAQWFGYNLIISVFAAYVAGHTLQAGTPYLAVFRIVGTTAWLGYSGGVAASSIWMGRPWSVTLKEMVDGLVYGLVTAGAFGWLWPR
jgi:hypothetical protein